MATGRPARDQRGVSVGCVAYAITIKHVNALFLSVYSIRIPGENFPFIFLYEVFT